MRAEVEITVPEGVTPQEHVDRLVRHNREFAMLPLRLARNLNERGFTIDEAVADVYETVVGCIAG